MVVYHVCALSVKLAHKIVMWSRDAKSLGQICKRLPSP